MLPVNPRLPLTDRVAPRDVPPKLPRDVPPNAPFEAPRFAPLNDDPLDPNLEPLLAEELPKCEPSRFETARFGAIVELRPDEFIAPRPLEAPEIDDDDPPKFPPCEFDAVIELLFELLFEFDPRDAPAALPPACVPAVLPVLGELLRAEVLPPRALAPPLLPLPNECQCPSAFAELAAPRPAGHPDVRAFSPFDPDRDALFVALFVALRPFAEFPAERPPYTPLERPPYIPFERPAFMPFERPP